MEGNRGRAFGKAMNVAQSACASGRAFVLREEAVAVTWVPKTKPDEDALSEDTLSDEVTSQESSPSQENPADATLPEDEDEVAEAVHFDDGASPRRMLVYRCGPPPALPADHPSDADQPTDAEAQKGKPPSRGKE